MAAAEHKHSLPDKVDVLVAGSGAAGLTSALTAASAGLSVLVIEAADRWGGTSAIGGGRVWIPPAEGPDDTAASATEYLTEVFGSSHIDMVEAFVESARDMARFVEDKSQHRFVPCPNYPDYHPHLRGWSSGGRAHDAAPITLDKLSPEAGDVLIPPGYVPITHGEWENWRFPSRFDQALIEIRRRDQTLTNGASLVASLLDGAIRAGAVLTKGASLLSAESRSDDTILVSVGLDGGTQVLHTSTLILATGGFDADPDLLASYLGDVVSVSASAPTNTGVALRVAQETGLAIENLHEGWWMPMVMVPGEELGGRPYPRALVRERGVPHQIVVNRAGSRFVDEAAPYHEFVKVMRSTIDGHQPNQEAWVVFDEQFRSRYSFPGLTPAGGVPSHIETDASIEGLARCIGVDAYALQSTIDRWNDCCSAGRDTDFGRGENHYDRYYGDPMAQHPNLGTINQPPFYAARVISGTVGSKGGPVTTTDGVVVEHDGTLRPGWYAVGNAGTYWTGAGYPGPGATLGIGMTFAFRAATDAIRLCQRRQSLADPGPTGHHH